MTDESIAEAADAVRRGELVVYPTETVYGLGADALDEAAIERVFEAKRRSREKPISLAAPTVTSALEYVRATDREERFMREFLPGPVTVLCEKREPVPDVLTGGRSRVGVRVPDHEVALDLLRETAPVTATSANVSGRPSATRVADVDDEIRAAAAVVVDGGETGGTGSTVVNVADGAIVREGPNADDVRAWLDANGGGSETE
ncbi:L-threonylcarbamoyladenylate synthase [Halorussus gelatinilyticus]|uniref:L-threonylcarbamoyladenylate synthase n=1 Tax=Halorussus gelatinilyticus TaxID=2937524 RepID=A0A8U0IM95_9EURY|nr:L-threonylcarbamoyladenylate synthase [Halorussus gelatinilyticus]UPW01741.1 L-threonylcarbamoyladenylate synthase [Halorussus gelatinilyticus]